MKRSDKNKAGVIDRKKTKRSSQSVQQPVWVERYLDHKYIDTGEGQVYAEDSTGAQVYNEDHEGRQIYAVKPIMVGDKEQVIQYPAKDAEKKNYFVQHNGETLYPINLTTKETYIETEHGYPIVDGKPVYPRDGQGKPIYYHDNEGKVLFIEKNGQPVYATDDQNNEIYPTLDGLAFPIHRDGVPVYTLNKDQDECYITDDLGNEYYLREGNLEKGARRHDGSYYYAKRVNNSEYYPKEFILKQVNTNAAVDNKEVLIKEEVEDPHEKAIPSDNMLKDKKPPASGNPFENPIKNPIPDDNSQPKLEIPSNIMDPILP